MPPSSTTMRSIASGLSISALRVCGPAEGCAELHGATACASRCGLCVLRRTGVVARRNDARCQPMRCRQVCTAPTDRGWFSGHRVRGAACQRRLSIAAAAAGQPTVGVAVARLTWTSAVRLRRIVRVPVQTSSGPLRVPGLGASGAAPAGCCRQRRPPLGRAPGPSRRLQGPARRRWRSTSAA
jgi:hypothetical protein